MSPTTIDHHIVVFAFPFGSHVAPLFSIIHKLAICSPTTHFSFFCIPVCNKSILSSYKHNMQQNIKIHDLWDGVPDGYKFIGKPQEDIELFMNAAPESFRKSIDTVVAETSKEINCLVSDAFFWFAAEMAEEMKVPWIAYWVGSPVSISAHYYTDLIRQTYGVEGKNETLKIIPGMSKIRIGDLPEGVLFGNLESLFSQMLHKMATVLPKADAIILNSFEELEPITTNDLKSKFKKFLSTGPFNLVSPSPAAPDVYGCIEWLDKQEPASVAYISFGSVVTPPPHELAALAEALEASKVPFLWSIKDHAKMHLPNGFLDRTKSQGTVVPWTPQMEVLGHDAVGVFITHCGWNSIIESITGGVPMICRPFFGDQRINGRMVEDVWEIGLKVEGGLLTKNGVIESLDQILSTEKGKKMRENIRTLKELAERAIGPKGNSSKNFTELADIVMSKKR
ncbi:anthocyanidin 3-O-glucosyltransferase 7 [Ricinus communis]|uniref:Glycosyltransferase n=1 Tax=Ricinus communis TaxID=3988 RepID=B9S1Z8_RICCO|nr:anthocyanidin 3-O-glucosyltransferase 7 [Ricinus communis]EEF42341.1 UDP-glucosyltransferase, putative [Ricinus communis]|eukprot:XP_002520017.1 anthocyanidin 3-O-glucosyltransferase 7 [Ricinus communis]